MSDYTKQLEEQNEELKTLLAKSQEEVLQLRKSNIKLSHERQRFQPAWHVAFIEKYGHNANGLSSSRKVFVYKIDGIAQHTGWIEEEGGKWVAYGAMDDINNPPSSSDVFSSFKEAQIEVENQFASLLSW